jgi:agmatinase
MNLPFDYEKGHPGDFAGLSPAEFHRARVVILPIPLERTTSYVPGTRSGPHEILLASSHLELWDEETETDIHEIGITTLPSLELPLSDMEDVVKEIRRVAFEIVSRGKFLACLGGEHTITAPVVGAAASTFPGLSVLQIDAHADLRDSFMGSRHSHACAMRRVLEFARCTQVGVRSLSPEEAEVAPTLPTEIFYDYCLRQRDDWIDRVVDSLSENVYITIDCDGLDPAIMPAVGTPEPGGLTWYEILVLLRRVIEMRRVVGCDLVELCPLPGMVAPNFLVAKLLYKILTYRFGSREGRRNEP